MGTEHTKDNGNLLESLVTPPEELESLLSKKEPRLSKGIRSYIRILKQHGHFEKAMDRRKHEVGKKKATRTTKAYGELHKTLRVIIETDDPQIEAENELRAVWLMHAASILDSDERVQGIIDILDSKELPLKEYLENNLVEIREEVERTLKGM
ncbi:hypothetical protein IID21_02860 [Patescibacteria group bacterium]|nr:hypothetical protein [Patescibacteria group bacterium]